MRIFLSHKSLTSRTIFLCLTVAAMTSAGLRSCVSIPRHKTCQRALPLANLWNPHWLWAVVSNWPFFLFSNVKYNQSYHKKNCPVRCVWAGWAVRLLPQTLVVQWLVWFAACAALRRDGSVGLLWVHLSSINLYLLRKYFAHTILQ